ncbi:MAG TPA: sigma-54 dependent transcriptional regulator [Longimicrobium sp.]|nr:sigma-54 dependent transcriptional regulator [Longimicrobium sp.]
MGAPPKVPMGPGEHFASPPARVGQKLEAPRPARLPARLTPPRRASSHALYRRAPCVCAKRGARSIFPGFQHPTPHPGTPLKVLLLDADRSVVRTLEPELDGAELHAAVSLTEGLRLIASGAWDLILLDADFSGAGMELLGRLHQDGGAAPVVLLTTRPSMDLAMEAIGHGAHDVLPKPIPRGRVREILLGIEEVKRLRPLPPPAPDESTIVGSSTGMMAVFKSMARASSSDATVLVLGESGTGKEMVARVLHSRSRRARGPFVPINCAAIPENLLESELFGHEKGAFTGAIGRRIGRFERATGGTLFLDEIGDMSLALQSKILRAIQEREIERVGGGSPVSIDVRIVAATNRDLAQAVQEGRFREDLFYRLAVVTLTLPPLRDRGADLDLLASHFVAQYAREHGRPIRAVAEELFNALHRYPWPGNVRQLRNTMERAVVMADGEILLPQHLPADVLHPAQPRAAEEPGEMPLVTLEEMEKRMIRRALRETGNNLTLAAERLGIHRNTLRRKIAEYGLGVAH